MLHWNSATMGKLSFGLSRSRAGGAATVPLQTALWVQHFLVGGTIGKSQARMTKVLIYGNNDQTSIPLQRFRKKRCLGWTWFSTVPWKMSPSVGLNAGRVHIRFHQLTRWSVRIAEPLSAFTMTVVRPVVKTPASEAPMERTLRKRKGHAQAPQDPKPGHPNKLADLHLLLPPPPPPPPPPPSASSLPPAVKPRPKVRMLLATMRARLPEPVERTTPPLPRRPRRSCKTVKEPVSKKRKTDKCSDMIARFMV